MQTQIPIGQSLSAILPDTAGQRPGRPSSPLTASVAPYFEYARKTSSNRSYPMGIFSRTRDIIAANVTDLLDKSQDPAKMIRMIILEMEEDRKSVV